MVTIYASLNGWHARSKGREATYAVHHSLAILLLVDDESHTLLTLVVARGGERGRDAERRGEEHREGADPAHGQHHGALSLSLCAPKANDGQSQLARARGAT